MKKITVVIPNLNGMKFLEGCLSSLRAQTEQSFDVILIDNGSSDGSVQYVREHYPEVRVRAYHVNTGFCRAVNDGILLSKTPYVLLLNNDTVLQEDVLERLLSAMERGGEKVFSASAKMVSLKDPGIIDDAGDFYCIAGWAIARGKGKSSSLYTEEEDCFACCAAAALYRRSVFQKIGLLDERHFAYLEDVDIGWRAGNAGYRNLFVPSAVVKHAGSATSGSRYNEFKVRQASGNNLYMIWKNMPPWQLALNFIPVTLGILVKAAYFARMGFLKAYLEGLARGLSMMKGIKAGGGPAVSPSLEGRMRKAGMKGRHCRGGKLKYQLSVQGQMLKGLSVLQKTWR